MSSSVPFAILRHATTDWNEDGRLQGMTDIPLNAAGIALAGSWRLPAPADRWRRVSSPLHRAHHTAELLQPGAAIATDSRLREMSFGTWEGRSIAQLRTEVGEDFLNAERRGLDFLPPGGESPRMVTARILDWAREIGRGGEPVVAVSHKAAIRALMAAATGWDMLGRAPVKLDWQRLHFFSVHADGRVTLDRPNVAFAAAETAAL